MRRTAHDPPARLVPHLQWQASYDLASVDRLVGWLESDRADLERQITQARARTERARAAAARRATAEAGLGARIAVRQRELDAIEKRHGEIVDAIRTAAGDEAAFLIAAARRESDAMRAAAAGTQSERRRMTP